MEVGKALQDLLIENIGRKIASIDFCNFRMAVINFLEQIDKKINEEDIIEGTKEQYIDQQGVFKYRNTIKIKNEDIKIQVSAHFTTVWDFYLDDILPLHGGIDVSKVLSVFGGELVTVVVEDAIYLVPLKVAEKLDLEMYNMQKVKKIDYVQITKELELFKVKEKIQIFSD